MAQAIIRSNTPAGGNKDFKINDLKQSIRTKSQVVVNYNLPQAQDSNSIVAGILGQKAKYDITFAIKERTDDYTNGTGSPSTYTIAEQIAWIWDNVIDASADHYYIDTNGNSYIGKISSIEITEMGTDPVASGVRIVIETGGEAI